MFGGRLSDRPDLHLTPFFINFLTFLIPLTIAVGNICRRLTVIGVRSVIAQTPAVRRLGRSGYTGPGRSRPLSHPQKVGHTM